ncbi:MAG TPA: leucine-rich repeat domain-containing protein [Luteibaculaceae bacterium]|nr:leucine-rich repeat domain-containing protein [Luteibaculaceae bacterium]
MQFKNCHRLIWLIITGLACQVVCGQRPASAWPAAGQVDSLRVLVWKKKVSANQLSELSNFVELRQLTLQNARLTAFPEEICNLKNLEYLSLGNNEIDSVPACICELNQLKTLELWENNIYNLPPCMERMKNLKVLDLRTMKYSVQEHSDLMLRFKHLDIKLSEPCDCNFD